MRPQRSEAILFLSTCFLDEAKRVFFVVFFSGICIGLTNMPRTFYKRCAFSACINHKGNPGVKFHMFPQNKALFEKWLQVLDNTDLSNVPHLTLRRSYSVCGDHFDVSQFQTPERNKLLTGVIPKRSGENMTFAAYVDVLRPTTSEDDQQISQEEIVE